MQCRECTKAFVPGAGELSQTLADGLWTLAVRTMTMMRMEINEDVNQGQYRTRDLPWKSS